MFQSEWNLNLIVVYQLSKGLDSIRVVTVLIKPHAPFRNTISVQIQPNNAYDEGLDLL